MHFTNRKNRLAVFTAATFVASCVVATVSRGEDPAPTTQNSEPNPPHHEMHPEWGPPPPGEFREGGPRRDGEHGGPHRPRPGGFGGPDGVERDMMNEREVRNGIGMGIVPRFGRFLPPMDEQIPDEDWQNAVALMSENSPTRLSLFNKIQAEHGENSNVVRILKMRMVGFMRMLEKAKETSPRTHEFALRQMKIEDDIISALGELREEITPERQEKLDRAVKA
ncbi:MAG TPA: hypothetical protein PK402_01675, partial [Tepidisphaeraceae bacterium]|nr:hypothetical protein [Tepidisphaeraceae bacterium]